MGTASVRVLLFLHLFVIAVKSAQLPKEFLPCHKTDANFLECLNKNIFAAVLSLERGNSELKMIPIDPLIIKEANIGRGTGPVDVGQNYTDINIHGITKLQSIKVTKADVDEFNFEFEGYFPSVVWKAAYKASGRILLLPIYGDGAATITLINATSTHKINGEFVTKKGITYAKCTSYELRMNPEKVTFNFENLFNGNKLLGDNMNQVMNDNWKELFDDVGSGYEDVIAAYFQNYVNQVFNRVSYKDIFAE